MSFVVHPLFEALAAAADGRFPQVDGEVEVHPPERPGHHAVVEFTGHAFVLTDRDPDELRRLGADGFGGVGQPEVLRWLAGVHGIVGSHDAVLVARATGRTVDGGGLPERFDLDAHPRVVRSRHHRLDVRVFGDERGLVTIGRGVVGRTEVSVEVTGDRSAGAGRSLLQAALDLVAEGRPVWAQVAPGNAASLRAFLSCGFVPIGAETLITPASADRVTSGARHQMSRTARSGGSRW